MGDVTYTSGRIETYSSSVNDGLATTYTYTYDDNGNITKITYGTGEEIRYVYDDIGQLIREDNTPLGATYVYTYDNAGNRTSKAIYGLTAKDAAPVDHINTFTYGYSTPTASGAVSWGDLLMTYNGTSNVYDKIGNPLSYCNGQTYLCAWSGRSLVEVRKNDVTYKFTYNDSGIRTSKTVNGVTTNYYLSGSQIVAEETSGNLTVYIYDATGAPIGFQYHAASYAEGAFDTYWYEKNVFGDIVAVYDEAGVKLTSYVYDAWGNFATTYHNNGANIPQIVNNPFTYRGYYYDRDLDLYYLNSRYYDPVVGRFINADGYVSTGQDILGYNMFAYCGNNPIIRKDATGQSWIAALVVTAVVAVCAMTLSGCSAILDPAPLPYKTADEAAMAFANSTYSSSSYIRHEYGTVIYSRTTNGTTTYDFATPVAGSPHSVGYGNVKIPLGTTKVATAHTHPNSNNFSGLTQGATSGDIPNAIRRGLDSYVIGPDLNLQKYSISSGTVSVVGAASPVTLTSKQKAALVSQFQISWDNHLGTCAFGCKHMTWPTP